MTDPIRLLIVDDSEVFVAAFRQLLAGDAQIEVVATAVDGREAIEKTRALRPDIVTMDMIMPGLGGLEAIEGIMSTHPTPILIVTSDPGYLDAHRCFDALSRGALELIAKPDLAAMDDAAQRALRERVRFLARVPVVHHAQRHAFAPGSDDRAGAGAREPCGVVGLVASTGGPSLLADLLAGLPTHFPLPIVVVQHLAVGFTPHFVSWLQSVSALKVRAGDDGLRLERGVVYLAPDGGHLLVTRRGRLRLDRDSPPREGHQPSGDVLLRSIAESCGDSGVGVVLTGMGRDGADGLGAIHRVGGVTMAQDAASCVVDGMPRAARELGVVQRVVTRAELSGALIEVALRVAAASRSASG